MPGGPIVSDAAPLPIAVDLQELQGFSWEAVFRRRRPIELEIGAGKAGFLLRRARARADHDFLGIEWASKFYRYAVDRMQRWGMTNVRLLRIDAGHFLRVVCPAESLTALHVYHPDPWPKKRQTKRRLIQPVVVEAAVRCLVHGGHWAVQTDHAEYFDVIRGLLTAHSEVVHLGISRAARTSAPQRDANSVHLAGHPVSQAGPAKNCAAACRVASGRRRYPP